jgi:hypothetical protein
MTFHGEARFASMDADGNLSLKTTVEGSGASTRSTSAKEFFRKLTTPFGGETILS